MEWSRATWNRTSLRLAVGTLAVCLTAAAISGCDLVRGCVSSSETPDTKTFDIQRAQLRFGYPKGDGVEWVESREAVPSDRRAAVLLRGETTDEPASSRDYWVADLRSVPSSGRVEARRRGRRYAVAAHRAVEDGARMARHLRKQTVTVARRTGASPALWRVRRNGAESFVFGTHHCLFADFDALLGGRIEEAFRQSRLLVSEIDLQRSMEAMLGNIGRFVGARAPLDERLDDGEWERLRDVAGEVVPAFALRRLPPWVAYALLMERCIDPDALRMDRRLQRRARAAGKSMRFLEEPEQQLTVFRKAVDLEVLQAALEQYDELRDHQSQLADAYKRGDVEKLEQLLDAPVAAGPDADETKRLLLDERTEAWMEPLRDVLADGGVFVAVGAGHVVGEDGILARLRAAGYETERVE